MAMEVRGGYWRPYLCIQMKVSDHLLEGVYLLLWQYLNLIYIYMRMGAGQHVGDGISMIVSQAAVNRY